jgi:hypothetical protein
VFGRWLNPIDKDEAPRSPLTASEFWLLASECFTNKDPNHDR